ncbi:MAG TPA: sigma-70 family RNA polymerase sigma factor [Xanthomonadaceae bacterium]|nr:sigma-70 family RNA polymerase sigma factor [Xanthomonadaceae bacterium]
MLQTAGRDPLERPARGAAAEDVRLMARVALEDVRAFEAVYRCYAPRLARFLRGMLRQPALVDEVLDDTMLVAWRKAHTWDAASQLSTWLFAIAYRQALKAARRDSPAQEFTDEPVAPASAEPDNALEQQQLHGRLAIALDALTPEHRAVVELTYYQGYNCREIAEIVGCPVATVKTRMFYARQRLRGLLAGEVLP